MKSLKIIGSQLTVTETEEEEELYTDAFNTVDLANNWFNSKGLRSGSLPPRIVWIAGDNKAFILERPPAHIAITYNDTDFLLPLPWQTFGIKFSTASLDFVEGLYLYTTYQPIASSSDILHFMPLPNIYTHGEVSIHHTFNAELSELLATGKRRTLTKALNYVIDGLWASEWNDEITHGAVFDGFNCLDGHSLQDKLTNWEAISIAESLELPYKELFTVNDLIEQLESEYPQNYVDSIDFIRQLAIRKDL